MPRPRPSADYTKTCSLCDETKLAEHFHSAPTSRDGLQSRCKACQSKLYSEWAKRNPDKRREKHKEWRNKNRASLNKRQREWHRSNPGKSAEYELKKNYGLAPGTFAKMLAAQDGKCAICRTEPNGKRRFHVDHCHDTGAVRGLLCSNCNLLIGHAKHSEVILGAAIVYLKSSRT